MGRGGADGRKQHNRRTAREIKAIPNKGRRISPSCFARLPHRGYSRPSGRQGRDDGDRLK